MLKILYFGITLDDQRIIATDKIEIGNGVSMLLFGDNSTGKSLLLQAINGDLKNYDGDILIKEKPPIFYKKRKKSILLENTLHILDQETIWKNILIPLPKISSRIQKKVVDLCDIANLKNIRTRKAKQLSFSQKKILEIIRAVIQIPYLILIDDLDNYFDLKKRNKALQILAYAIDNGSSVVATSKTKLDGFQEYFRIQNKKVMKL